MRAILLDLDDTLIDDRGSTRVALEAFLAAHQIDIDHQERLLAWRSIAARHWARYESGEITFLEQRRCRVSDFLGLRLSDEEADEALLPYVSAYEQSWELLPGVSDFLDRTRHVPKVIITNGERDQQMRKIRATGLTSHIVGAVTPSDCGHWKPHPGIFLAALTMLDVQAPDCLMIGDDESLDIEPARRLGMQYFLVQPGDQERSLSRVVMSGRGRKRRREPSSRK